MPLPLLNRVAHLTLNYTPADLQTFLATYGEEESHERTLALELSGFLDTRPELLEVDPSAIVTTAGGQRQDFVADITAKNETWASPRAWERTIQFMAQLKRELTENPKLVELLHGHGEVALSGIVGSRAASLYLSMRQTEKCLPAIKEIIENPQSARLPKDAAEALAIAGYLPRLGFLSPAAAWVYVGRFSSIVGSEEIIQQLLPALTRHCAIPKEDKGEMASAARKIQLSITTDRVIKKAKK